MTATVTPRSDRGEVRVEPAGNPQRRVRLPWVAFGVVMVTVAAIAAALVAGRAAQRDMVVGLARPVERGTVLTDADLTGLAVAVDARVPVIAESQRDELIGRRVLTSLPAGALLSEELVTAAPVATAGQRVVGLALSPGEYPVAGLTVGDVVQVVRTGSTAPSETGNETLVAASEATVYAVAPVAEGLSELLVSLAVPDDESDAVVAAAAAGQARLVLLGAGS